MKRLDKFLQKQRLKKAIKYISEEHTILDIGCSNGELLEAISFTPNKYIGIDPLKKENLINSKKTFLKGTFPEALIGTKYGDFDVCVLLAVLEHIPEKNKIQFENSVYKYLKHGGVLIITVPSKKVDFILSVLKFFKLIDGMSLEEHHGFSPKDTLSVFKSPHWELINFEKFQFGLNNLFVFKKRTYD
ncbi:MAG: class I SAM-dependent methyltransferase [Bacteroidetes bacterium]|nr:class I SAM-dependent methyltransferase [Bacteroidota bacterium]